LTPHRTYVRLIDVRWDRQRTDRADQALPGLEGLLRSVRSPEFDGITFHEVHARSVLNKVPGASRVPFSWTVNPYRGCSHACTYCLAGETEVLMADGRTRPLADLQVDDEIYGTARKGRIRRFVPTRVLAHWSTVKPAYRVTLADGTTLVAGGDHRFLTDRGWKHVTGSRFGAAQRPHLTTRNRLLGTGAFPTGAGDTREYRAGYLCGMTKRNGETDLEAMVRVQNYRVAFAGADEYASIPSDPGRDWQKGLLAGVFDAGGRYSHGVLRLPATDPELTEALCAALEALDFGYTVEDSANGGGRTIKPDGGLRDQLRFFLTVDPAVTRKRKIDGSVIRPAAELEITAIEPTGADLPLFDITTGTGDFIANGVVSHNCFARNTHTYLDFDAGRDFDTQVVVKVNAPEVLAAQLRRPSWTREHVAMGTNTDPYQRAEGRYQLMPGIIRALAGSGTPFSILTKGTVLTRDLPLLESVHRDVPVGLGVSIALLDRELQHRLEPGTPSPQARLELVRRAREAGLPVGVMVAPVLPGLTDSREALDELLAAIADAGATGVTVLPLHLRPGAREWFARWLGDQHPDLVPRYRELYARGSYVTKAYRTWLADRVAPLIRRHGLGPREEPEETEETEEQGIPGEPEGRWPRGSVPKPRDAEEPAPRPEQLPLL
jgi:DNA repair photolyase